MSEIIRLTQEELDNIIKNNKKIGQGTEGTCFNHDGEVYKIYHKTGEQLHAIATEDKVDEDGTKIYDKNKPKHYVREDNRIFKYTDEDGVKLGKPEALNRALAKGYKITKSRLPHKIILVDGKLKGCVYPYYKHTKSIYSAYRKPFKTRLLICQRLIEQVKELLDNNIYPIDLCQKFGGRTIFDKSVANVLLDWKNNPIIIDLEGKSTLYTDSYNPLYASTTCYLLATLILEIMTREDIQEDFIDEDFDLIHEYLNDIGLPDELIQKYIDNSLVLDDVYQMFDLIASKKHITVKR